MFQKLDSDADGRVSAIEAANDSKVAAAFTAADADRDGYLSKAEFAQLGQPSNPDTAPPRNN
ncbi:MAG TPA: EF-hand domain-containing protein, partial [Steroidobacteraceae bacterium]|nr:EF-hand domain-containing protein [Steroidobacteraceae bacterium]